LTAKRRGRFFRTEPPVGYMAEAKLLAQDYNKRSEPFEMDMQRAIRKAETDFGDAVQPMRMEYSNALVKLKEKWGVQ
jgi:hypothetical protein